MRAVKRHPLVVALEVAASLAAVALSAYVMAALFVAWFTPPIGAHR